jgi:hypothetical protein
MPHDGVTRPIAAAAAADHRAARQELGAVHSVTSGAVTWSVKSLCRHAATAVVVADGEVAIG